MKTQAAILESKDSPFKIEEVDLADPGMGEVRVRIEACGICRSDLSALAGKEPIRFPAVLGHEGAGVVEAVGPGVRALKEGDKVILSWTPACGACPPCKRGEVHLCRKLAMSTGGKGALSRGGKGIDRFMALGAFCRHVVVPESMAVAVKSDLSPVCACLIGCGVTTGFGAATKTAALRWGESAAVIGCGGVGLSAIQGARVAGASRIFAIDPVEERRQAALKVGATDALDPKGAAGKVMSSTDGGVDVAIECVGRPATMLGAFNLIRPGGRAIVVGLPGFGEMLQIPAILLLTGKTITGSIYGSANPAVDFQKIAALAAQGRVDLNTLAGKVRPFAEINEGVAEMKEGKLTRVVLSF